MIKFFRKIRQKLITENNVSKYLIYAIGEIVLVVVGILIALQINNWNNERQLRNLELKLLKEICVDLKSDLPSIESSIKWTLEKENSAVTLQNHLINKLPLSDSLSYHMSNLTGTTHYQAHASAFETLKNTDINILQNDVIRKAIIEYYSFSINHIVRLETEDVNQFLYGILWPQIISNIKVNKFKSNAEAFDYENLITNKKFHTALVGITAYRNTMSKKYSLQRQKAINLITLIEEEINSLE